MNGPEEPQFDAVLRGWIADAIRLRRMEVGRGGDKRIVVNRRSLLAAIVLSPWGGVFETALGTSAGEINAWIDKLAGESVEREQFAQTIHTGSRDLEGERYALGDDLRDVLASARVGERALAWTACYRLLETTQGADFDRWWHNPVHVKWGQKQRIVLGRDLPAPPDKTAILVPYVGDTAPVVPKGIRRRTLSGEQYKSSTQNGRPVLHVRFPADPTSIPEIMKQVERARAWHCSVPGHEIEIVSDLLQVLEPAGEATVSAEGVSGHVPFEKDVPCHALAALDRRAAVADAHPAESDRPEGEDKLAIKPVVQAMAWTIALKETQTPLCIGIFGPWGSGKSFLMRKIETELTCLAQAPVELQSRFVEKIRTLTFNAWTYAKADLWSAILFEILSQLDDPYAEVEEARRDVDAKRAVRDAAQAELVTARQQLDREQPVLNRAKLVFEHRMDEYKTALLAEAESLTMISSESWAAAFRVVFWWTSDDPEARRKGKKLWFWLGIAVLGVIGSVWGLSAAGIAHIKHTVAAWWTAAVGAVSVAVRAVSEWLAAAKKARDRFDKARKDWKDKVAATRKALKQAERAALVKRREALKPLETRAKDAASEFAGAEKKLAEAEKKLPSTPRRTLGEFVRARLAEGDYRERLGHLQRVEEDLAELANILAQDKMTDRLVLFIDDLDRCPPPQIVEVLEAVQLLLAENRYIGGGEQEGDDPKVRMSQHPFVVVIGADTRVLTRALESDYSAVLDPEQSPSGLDYLEKIIQIPYRVPPVDDAGFRSYVAKLTRVKFPERADVEDSGISGGTAHGGATTLDPLEWKLEPGLELITGDDLVQLASYRDLAATYPRAIKRMINQFRLCKIIGVRSGSFACREMAFLLSIASGFRATTRALVERLADTPPSDGQTLVEYITTVLKRPQPSPMRDDGKPPEPTPLERELETLLRRLDGMPAEDVPLPADLQPVLRFAIPFCFLGDLEGSAARIVG